MTAGYATFQVQELCDHITAFIQSSAELRSCALVSHTFASSAQRLLFHDIILSPGISGINDIYAQHYRDDAAICGRFISVLHASPHLIPLVRRLRVALDERVVQLSQIKFSHLRDIVFHRNNAGTPQPANDAVCLAVAKMIALPSIRRLGLINAIFDNPQSFAQLCLDSTPQLESLFLYCVNVRTHSSDQTSPPARRASIQQLQLIDGRPPQWLLNPLSPFDFSQLTNVDLFSMRAMVPITIALIDGARSTITRLKLNADFFAKYDQSNLTMLATLPALQHLSVFCHGHLLEDVEMFLALLPTSNRVEFLELEINKGGQITAATWLRLGRAVAAASLPLAPPNPYPDPLSCVHCGRLSAAEPVANCVRGV
ncbi:hypothetical protein MVEN_01396400 [Mycena venus]|uniref:Uncharacterized protein n=1 Tax=Mycena venus TaxID=2733690 RepID=A0A8H6XYN0_9AGAR|nr:hypothetical protein MVEN_01396400 [Mycena venus]